MNIVKRTRLAELLNKYDGKLDILYSDLAAKSQPARSKLNYMYNKKPIKDWTQEEKENLLGFMLGYNIIEG